MEVARREKTGYRLGRVAVGWENGPNGWERRSKGGERGWMGWVRWLSFRERPKVVGKEAKRKAEKAGGKAEKAGGLKRRL